MQNHQEKTGFLEDKKKPPFLISVRFSLALLVFLGYGIQYTQKIDMSVGIVCMVNNTALNVQKANALNLTLDKYHDRVLFNENKDNSNRSACMFQTLNHSSSSDGQFVWSKKIQGYILASYFYGYAASEIPGGFLSYRFGGKIVFFVAMLLGSILTLLAPVSAQMHYGMLIAIRFLTGLVHGVVWPAVSSLWANWAVPAERSRLIGIGNAGSQIGNVVALPLGAYLCVNGFAGGWPSIFYIFGIVGLVLCAIWFFLVSDSPRDNRIISKLERDFIVEETASQQATSEMNVPWKAILTSKPCIAIFVAHFCSNCGIYLFLTNIPTYMKEVLKFDIKSNGLLSALPYVVFWFVIILSGVLGDKFLQTKCLTRTWLRKIFNTAGFILPMISIICLSFIRCDQPYLGVVFLILGLSFNGCAYGAGFLVNFIDVGGKYGGIVFGISNTTGSIPGIIAPYLVGFLTQNQRYEEWRTVFLITAAFYLFGAIFYLIFGSGSLQPWAVKKESVEIENKPNEPESKLIN